MFKRKGGGESKAFWTMFKKTALFSHDGFPKVSLKRTVYLWSSWLKGSTILTVKRPFLVLVTVCFFKITMCTEDTKTQIFFTAFQTCLSLFVCCCWEQCAPCLLYFSPWMCIKSPHVFPKKLYVFLQESICMSSEPGARSRSLANFSLDRALAISSSTPFLFVIIVIAIVIDIMIETIIFISHIIASDVHNVIIVFQCKAQ